MVDWLRPILVALAVMVGLRALLVVLAAQLPAGLLKDQARFVPACVTPARRLRADPACPGRPRSQRLSGMPKVLHVTLGQRWRAGGRGGGQQLRGGALAKRRRAPGGGDPGWSRSGRWPATS